eukprot:SM000071S21107  [mRNA]  locus=s71:401270:404624:+ [translate_table: standard]
MEGEPLHVVVAGAGPAGLLLAHYLLHFGGGRFRVSMFERGHDPRRPEELDATSGRRYSMGLNKRGLASVAQIPGLLDKVKGCGVQVEHITSVIGGVMRVLRKRKGWVPPCMVDRQWLCRAMLEDLLDKHGSSGMVKITHNAMGKAVDLTNHNITFTLGYDDLADIRVKGSTVDGTTAVAASETKDVTVPYDLLVGADGVRSVVRLSFIQQTRNFHVEMSEYFRRWLVTHVKTPPGMDSSTVHFVARVPRGASFGVVAIPLPGRELCIIGGWSPHEPPLEFLNSKSPKEAQAWLNERVPHLQFTEEAAWTLAKQTPRITTQVKCGRYHDTQGRAVLMGDAAHATSPSLGQGCNSAFVDASVLARLLLGERVTETTRVPEDIVPKADFVEQPGGVLSNLPSILERYSALQVPEGHAVVDMSCGSQALNSNLQFRQQIWTLLRARLCEYLPSLIAKPIFALCGETNMPYKEVLKILKSEVDVIAADNERIKRQYLLKCNQAVLERPLSVS